MESITRSDKQELTAAILESTSKMIDQAAELSEKSYRIGLRSLEKDISKRIDQVLIDHSRGLNSYGFAFGFIVGICTLQGAIELSAQKAASLEQIRDELLRQASK